MRSARTSTGSGKGEQGHLTAVFGFGEPQITKLPPILVTNVIGEIDAVRGGAAA